MSCAKGNEKVHGRSSGNKTQITVVVCASAAGNVIPPMVIFKGERLNHELTKGEVPGTLYGLLENGWIDHELFFSLAKQPLRQAHTTHATSLIIFGWSLNSLHTRGNPRVKETRY